MKKWALFFLLGFSLLGTLSCKKFIDKQKENYLLGIMTDGRWYLQTYAEGGIDYSYLFASYEFQFYKDEKVDAISGSSVTNGTWKGDVSNLTMTSNFPSAQEPVKRLNQTWKVTDYYVDAVFAEVTTSNGLASILLRKK
ncbi:MAG: hypothetical protein INR73_23055 [Williamsia sp.]|nr:hypothetical protein [Williamsia sp.]